MTVLLRLKIELSGYFSAADVIIGNPPFLGVRRLRRELGDVYVDRLFSVYRDRVPREADLVTYWFERARELVASGTTKRAGLIATNSIRGGPNRRVLQRIKDSGDIFFAYSDRPWVLDGADVRVSMVGFDNGDEATRTLDGVPVTTIHADLTAASDLTVARRLRETWKSPSWATRRAAPSTSRRIRQLRC